MKKVKCRHCNGLGSIAIHKRNNFSRRRQELMLDIIEHDSDVQPLISQGLTYAQLAMKMTEWRKSGLIYESRGKIRVRYK